jgi:hypothetical protein
MAESKLIFITSYAEIPEDSTRHITQQRKPHPRDKLVLGQPHAKAPLLG